MSFILKEPGCLLPEKLYGSPFTPKRRENKWNVRRKIYIVSKIINEMINQKFDF